MKLRLLIFCLLLPLLSAAQIIDTNRVTTWQDTVGIPGGIPNSSNMTVYVTVSAGNMNESYLQTQIDNCPSNQVIQLPSGTYAINGTLNFGMNHGVVLRGAGMFQTILTGMHIYMGQSAGSPTSRTITNGTTKGSTSIQVSGTTTAFRVNDYLMIEGGDDPDIVILPGTEDSGQGQPCQKFAGLITNVSGQTISFTPPLPYKHLTSGAYNSEPLVALLYNNASATPNFVTKCGVEHMSIGLDSAWDYGVDLHSVAYCWFKNVEIYHSGQRMLYIQRGYGCEVFHCFIHDSTYQGPYGYGVTLEPAFSCLIANNLASNLSGTFQVNEGSSGNVFGYNYSVKTVCDFANNIPDFQNHNPTPVMNLFEGNWGYMFFFDDIHGSAAYSTVFRNRITGYQPANGSYGTVQNFCLVSAVNVQYNNYVANVLGDVPGATTNISTYIRTNENYSTTTPAIIALDADATSPYTATTNASRTTFIHANWDSVNQQIMWDAWRSTNTTRTIPDSYYLSAKPSWWGNLAWPPFNPSNATAAAMSPTNLPIGYFATYGSDPPADGGGGSSSATANASNFNKR